MRILYPTALLFIGAGAASPGLAHDFESCVPMQDAGTPVCHHYFERTSIELPVREQLDSIGIDCDRLVVRVLQRQGLLLAELQEPLRFDQAECSAMTSIALNLPDVRSETDILVQFSLAGPENGQGDDLQDAAAVIALRVYPDTLLEPLVRFAEQRSLIVIDDNGKLSDFLDRNGIGYVQSFAAISEMPIALLVQPREPERLLEDRGIDAAVIFREKIVDLPQIRSVSNDGQSRVYVEMEFLHDLPGNPLAQKALLKIINLAINPYQTDRG